MTTDELLSEDMVKPISEASQALSEMCSELERAWDLLSGKMASLERVAKQLNDTLENSKGAMQGVAGASDGLSDDMETMTKAFSSFKDIVAGGKFWENMSGGVTKLREKLTGLQKGAVTVTAAFAEFDIISDTFEGLMLGSEEVSEGIGKMSLAAATAGTAMYAVLGPAGIVIAAITGVIGAIKGLNEAHEEMRQKFAEQKELELFGEKVTEITDKIDMEASSIRDRIEAANDYLTTVGFAEVEMTQTLADRYFELFEKQNLSNEEKREMIGISEMLVETIPELRDYYDEETRLINATKECVDELIGRKLQEIQLNAAEEKLTEAYKARYDAMENLSYAADKFSVAQQEIKRLQEEYENSLDLREALREYQELTAAIADGRDTTSEALERQKELESLLTDGGRKEIPTYSELSNQAEEAKKRINDLQDSYMDLKTKFLDAGNVLDETETHISVLMDILKESMQGVGENTVDGYTEGILNKRQEVEATMNELGDISTEALEQRLGVESPSKVFMQIGRYAVEGFNIGFEIYEKETLFMINNFASKIVEVICTIASSTFRIGADAMAGLYNGLSGGEAVLYEKVHGIAGNIVKTIRKVLDINSPSRVMFGLGSDTMQGYQNGLEHLYPPIISSVKDFGYNLQSLSELRLDNIYQDVSRDSNNAETNALLRKQNELLKAILQKPVVSNDEIFNAAKSVYKGEANRRFGSSTVFDPVWG